MEENSNYTFKVRREKTPANTRQLAIFGGAAAVLLILAIVLGVVAGKASARKKVLGDVDNKPSEAVSQNEEPSDVPVASVPESTTDENDPYPASDKYPAGRYVVSGTNGNGLNVRSAPNTDAERIGHFDEGESVTVLKVVEIADASSDSTKYWGQVKVGDGTFGYLSMSYLKAE